MADTLAEYAALTNPLGSDNVVIARPGLMVIDRLAVFVKCVPVVESVTVMAAVVVPAVVGLPVIAPPVLMESPAGKPVAVNGGGTAHTPGLWQSKRRSQIRSAAMLS